MNLFIPSEVSATWSNSKMIEKLTFKQRLIVQYTVVSGIIFLLIFLILHYTVHKVADANVDRKLLHEIEDHLNELSTEGNTLQFGDDFFKSQREHQDLVYSPVFIQIFDRNGKSIDRSPNLSQHTLPCFSDKNKEYHFETALYNFSVRAAQIPVKNEKGIVVGFYTAAVSLAETNAVIETLHHVLLYSFPIVLLLLIISSIFLANNNVKSLRTVINKAREITADNLTERLVIPNAPDEVRALFQSFNELLARMEKALDREKNFAAFASHELRTPLTAVQGHLEILIRKPRTPEEYQLKIQYCLGELSKLNHLVEQLLLLAKESQTPKENLSMIALSTLINNLIALHEPTFLERQLAVDFQDKIASRFLVPENAGRIILDNVLRNAIKYSPDHAKIKINFLLKDDHLIVKIKDEGSGIENQELSHVFETFYRGKQEGSIKKEGFGLGLALAKKWAKSIGGDIQIESSKGQGTTVNLIFKTILRD